MRAYVKLIAKQRIWMAIWFEGSTDEIELKIDETLKTYYCASYNTGARVYTRTC